MTAPQIAEKGEPGEDRWLELELKLVADAGIIGVPNAGKSTLLSVVSAATPKIADYPFTTVEPNLGVAEVNHRQIVLVDIPGLLEGAHEGRRAWVGVSAPRRALPGADSHAQRRQPRPVGRF